MLKMSKIGKVYRTGLIETAAIEDLSLDVGRGDFVSLMGPSGSGKTTFLNIAGLLDTFDRGRYLLDDVDVAGLSDDQQSRLRNERIGFIFQSFNLIPDLDVYDNIEVPLRYRRMAAAERRDRVEEVLVQMGLTARMRHLPSQLSGGQQQRVAIARALVGRPQLLLADEPTATSTPSRRARCWTCSKRSTPNGRRRSSWSRTIRRWPRAPAASCTCSTGV
jgi:putative ABC transport system ATP-binding protein